MVLDKGKSCTFIKDTFLYNKKVNFAECFKLKLLHGCHMHEVHLDEVGGIVF